MVFSRPPGTGSSPRVWGARIARIGKPHIPRLIPTCVGSTSLPSCVKSIATAHPHVCGEHVLGYFFGLRLGGSSPRVWGALVREGFEVHLVRLIPTCVGSTGRPL